MIPKGNAFLMLSGLFVLGGFFFIIFLNKWGLALIYFAGGIFCFYYALNPFLSKDYKLYRNKTDFINYKGVKKWKK